MPPPIPPQLSVTAPDGNEEVSPVDSVATFAFSSHSRRPSAATLVASDSRLQAAGSNLFLDEKKHKPSESLNPVDSRNRSTSIGANSIGGASMFSGDTERPRTPESPTGSFSLRLVNTRDALAADPGTEHDFHVENNPFAFTPGQMNKFLNPKSLSAFRAVGGIQGLEKGLRTDLTNGLSAEEGPLDGGVTFDEAKKVGGAPPARLQSGSAQPPSEPFADRKRVFGDNSLPPKKSIPLWQIMWLQYKDPILIILTFAAIVSLGLGLYDTLGKKHTTAADGEAEPRVDWIEGVAICVAILVVVAVGSLNDFQKERQFMKLNAKKEDRVVNAIRSGRSVEVPVSQVMAGDVLHIEPGFKVPADGIFIQGHNVKCDESSATGESDQMKKTPGGEAYRQIVTGTASAKLDPFILSGSQVLEGVGTYVVTSTGVNSTYGRLMMSLREETEPTPLQEKLARLAKAIGYLGGGASALLFFVLFFRFVSRLPNDTRSATEKAETFTDILIVCITLIVVAIPEGLPLAVTLALAFATIRMLKENNLVRILRACETMGNATTVCSDKTGTLTQNVMTVVTGIFGQSNKFDNLSGDSPRAEQIVSQFSAPVRDIILQSIAINSTAFEGFENGQSTFVGSKTETALLGFAQNYLDLRSLQQTREHAEIVQLIPFDSRRKCMGVVVRLQSGIYRLYVKGASEILLAKATRRIADMSSPDLAEVDLTDDDVNKLGNTIVSFAERSLRTIGILYKDYASWPPVGARALEDDSSQAEFDDLFTDMVFLGIVGIQDPLRPGVTKAVAKCARAGVKVRMVTGDNVVTAKAIATECGIYTPGGIVMEGPDFRRLSQKEMDEVLPHLDVLARSSPEDKRTLVARLKQLGGIVAVTGDGTNDGPALKTADIGFSMGISGTDVAKEASSIILMDDNFASIVKALMWGRAVNDAVQKFLQFQLTVNITAVLLTFVSAVQSKDNDSVLTAVQLLWVNLIMDTLAAIALASDSPTEEILDRKPTPRSAGLVSLRMWKMIIGQAIFQLAITYTLHFGGSKIFPWSAKELDSVVFNTFVWMQIFNEINNRRLDNKLNVFSGVQRNWFFIGITVGMVAGQVLIMFVGGTAFTIVRINGAMWGLCIGISSLSLPWAIVIRCTPDSWVESAWNALGAPVVKVAERVGDVLVKLIPGRKTKGEAEKLEDGAFRNQSE